MMNMWSPTDLKDYKKLPEGLEDDEKSLLDVKRNIYAIDFENLGGLVKPLVLEIKYTNGGKEILRIPAEIWRKNAKEVSKLLVTKRSWKAFIWIPIWNRQILILKITFDLQDWSNFIFNYSKRNKKITR